MLSSLYHYVLKSVPKYLGQEVRLRQLFLVCLVGQLLLESLVSLYFQLVLEYPVNLYFQLIRLDLVFLGHQYHRLSPVFLDHQLSLEYLVSLYSQLSQLDLEHLLHHLHLQHQLDLLIAPILFHPNNKIHEVLFLFRYKLINLLV